MKKLTKIVITGGVVISLLTGCRREELADAVEHAPSVTIKSGRLVFNEIGSFKELLSNTKNKGKDAVFTELKSILDSKGQKELSMQRFASFEDKTVEKLHLKANMVAADQMTDLDSPDMIPDTEFAALVNQDGEIQVGEAVYKVTTFGTFVTTEGSLDELNTLLDTQASSDNISENIPSNPLYANPIGNDVYKVNEDILLVDTYKRASSEEAFDLRYEYPDDGSINSGGYTPPTAGPVVVEDPEAKYKNLAEVNFHAKTVVGGWIEGLFGRNVTSGRYFGSTRRVKTTFFNLNFGLYFTMGCSVHMQKKNWIGWSGTACQELRLGWDYVKIKYKFPEPMPLIANANVVKPTNYNFKFPQVTLMNTGVVFNTLDYRLLDLIGVTLSLDDLINNALTKGYRDVPKYMYNMIKNTFYLPEPSSDQKFAIERWSDDSTKEVVYGRYERILLNGESINQNFDRGGFASFSYTGGSVLNSIATGLLNNVVNHGIETTVTKASVYGIAKYNNQWLGSRIIAN